MRLAIDDPSNNARAMPEGTGTDAADRIVLGFDTRGLYRGRSRADAARITTARPRHTGAQTA